MRTRWLAAILVCAASGSAFGETLRLVRIETPNAPVAARQLMAAGFDVLENTVTAGSFEVIASMAGVDVLRGRGLDVRIIAVGRPFREIQAERRRGVRGVPPDYLDLSQIYAEMSNAASAYPAICQFVNLTTTYNAPATSEGRQLFAVKISDNVTEDEDEPAVLIVSNHHARELVTPVLALHAIEQLTTQYGTDPQITAAVDAHEIWIAPTWNPDGYEYVFSVDNMWRKNRTIFKEGIGVDQNRNYPFGWTSACSGSTDPGTETYKGPGPASEAETQTMMAWSLDRRFSKVIDYHSSGREVLWAYACLTHPFEAFLEQEAIDLSNASGYAGSNRPPSADGEHYQWQLGRMAAHAFLIETHTSFQPTYASAQDEATLTWPGLLWMLERPVPVWGNVTDMASGGPVTASISYPDVTFSNGETNASGAAFGRYHAFLPPGTYDIFFVGEGFDAQTAVDVVVNAGASTNLDVALIGPPIILSPNGGEMLEANVETAVSWLGGSSLKFHVQHTADYGEGSSVSDGFEGGPLDPAYNTGGNQPWFVSSRQSHSGALAARSGMIGDGEESWMTRTAAGGALSFWYFVSSEPDQDFFNFTIEGVNEIHASGELGWTLYATTVLAGRHELKWEYVKNGSVSGGDDAAWIDDLQFMENTTVWSDVATLTGPGASSVPWTPTQPGESHKVRARAFYEETAGYSAWDESDETFAVCVRGEVSIATFVGILLGIETGTTLERCSADANGDGLIDGGDIQPFVDIALLP